MIPHSGKQGKSSERGRNTGDKGGGHRAWGKSGFPCYRMAPQMIPVGYSPKTQTEREDEKL